MEAGLPQYIHAAELFWHDLPVLCNYSLGCWITFALNVTKLTFQEEYTLNAHLVDKIILYGDLHFYGGC